MADRKKAHRRHLPVFFIILFIGLSGLFITKTEFGFNAAYRILRNYLKRDLGYTLSISDLNKRLDTRLQADKLEFANDDSSLVFSIDTTNIHYSGIFELLGKRRVDSLRLQKPEIYIRSKGRSDKAPEITGLNFPRISIGHITLSNAKVEIETPDTLFRQTVDHAEFSYSGAGDRARFDIHDMRMENKALDLRLHTVSSEVTVNNNIAKLRNLCFRLNEAEFNSSGKIRVTDSLRFQFLFSIRDIRPARYYEHRLIDPGDKLSVKLELMGSLKTFYAALNISGSINRKTIRQANVNIEYKDDYLHILEASFKNEDTDISVYGSYGIKDKYLTSTFTSYKLNPSDWFPDLPEFAFLGRMRASGYTDKRMSANYSFQCLDLYGIDESRMEGNVFVDEMRDIILDSTNYIYLPDGVLKARGKITGLDSADLDIYGDIADLDPLGPEADKDLKMKNILLTLRVLGELKDPDVQLNLNMDTFAYDRYSVNDLNLSLYGNGIFSEPGGAVLLSFDDAAVDSFLIGNVQTYVRMDGNTVNVDYFDISHENYSLSLSGNARDFTTFTLNSMQGRYMNEDVYLLDSVSFSFSDNGISLSRFDLLYRDALLYGALDTKRDSVRGNVNITGAELSSLPLLSTLEDSIGGRLEVNLEISGLLDDPRISAVLDLRNAHAFGLDTRRISARSFYRNKRLHIDDIDITIADERSIGLSADLPAEVNFTKEKIFRFLPEDSLHAEFAVEKARLSKFAPFLTEAFPISGEGNIRGRVSGTLNAPLASGELLLLDPVIDKIRADTLRSGFRYMDRRIYFNDAYLTANNGHYRGNGHAYLDLSFRPEGKRFSPDSTLYAYIQGTDDELIYLTPYIRNVESLTGDIHTELEIKGSVNETVKNGRVSIRDGNLVLSMLSNEIINLRGETLMRDNIMKVDLRGKLPSASYTLADVLGLSEEQTQREHNFAVGGSMDMKKLFEPVFDLSLTGDGVSIVTLDNNINLTTGEVDLAVTGQDTLLVSGDLNIREGNMEMGFNRPAEMQEQTERRKLYSEYSINTIVEKLYFRTQFIDATLQGEMNLLKYAGEENLRLGGELDITQGFFNYWASVFELEEGSIQFDQFEGNHELNFIASKTIRGGNRIIASITGELNNPEINFVDAENQMSSAEIVQELTIGEIRNAFPNADNAQFAARTTTALLALAERPLEQQAQKLGGVGGLDRIDIKGGEGTYIDSTTAVVVGGRIGRNFYLTYEGSRNSPLNIEVEYRINNRLSVVGSADEESVSGSFRLRVQY